MSSHPKAIGIKAHSWLSSDIIKLTTLLLHSCYSSIVEITLLILIGGSTRGNGKSCLALNIAVYIQKNINDSVLLVDCEPQKDLSLWAQKRIQKNAKAAINCVQISGHSRQKLLSMSNHFDFVVIDCSTRDFHAMQDAISLANRILLPIRLQHKDCSEMSYLSNLIASYQHSNTNAHHAFVLNQCPIGESNGQSLRDIKAKFDSENTAYLDNVIYDRSTYHDTQATGLSVIEAQPDGDAANEIRNIFNESVFDPHFSRISHTMII
ncbi:MAG: chromosome partitioning protein ParA [Aestuariibacter sp.]